MKLLSKTALLVPAMLVCFFCITCISGCGPRLATTQSIDVSPNDIRTILIDAISSEQTVTVEATSTAPFSLHAHLAGEEEAVDNAIMAGKASPKILDQSVDQTTAKLDFVVPAEKEGAIRFSTNNSDGATVQYTISN